MNKNKKIIIISYAVTAVLGLIITFCLMLYWEIFKQKETTVILRIFCDSFFVTGAMMSSVGLLIWISTTGFFDMIAYGFKNLLVLFTPVKYDKDKHEKYFDYHERKLKERIRKKEEGISLSFILIVGIVFILISLTFLLGLVIK